VVARLPDVFLSYSREDQPTARRFADALQREGFSVWWDQALDAGESFDKVTEQALKEARAVVVLWSKHSVDSRWVRAEATQADRFGTLVPVTIEQCDRPIMFELTHTAELSGWSGDIAAAPWRAFIEGLRRSVGRDSALPPVQATPAVSNTSPTGPRARRWIAWGAAASALVLAAGLAWHFLGRTGPASETVAATASSAAQSSVAVLPFDDLSSTKDQQYFADGVAEEILNQLARIDGKQLRVIARNSSFAFRGGNQNLKQVGEKLGVEHLLEGSVRKAGDQLRITAQLINTKTDAHLWSHTYNRPLTDVFAVQEEIARAVAEALQISLGVGIGARPGMTRNVEAYATFLEAGVFTQLSTEAVRHSIELLQRAVAEDPTFALAWIGLSDMYLTSALIDRDANQQDFRERAESALKEAQRLQPDLPEVFAELADRSMNSGHWKEAMAHQREFEIAAAKYGTPDDLKGTLLMRVGRVREALPLLEAYKARDPLNPGRSVALVNAYSASGNASAAYSELKRVYGASEGPPTTMGRLTAMQLALDGRDRTLLVRALDDGIVNERLLKVNFYAPIKERLDKPDEALAFLRPWVTPQQGVQGLIGSAMFLGYFGDPDSALKAITFLSQRSGLGVGGAIWSPSSRDMRKLPAFKNYVRDTGLVDYWREYGWGDFCKPTTGDDFECH
jgi:TolB-like protein